MHEERGARPPKIAILGGTGRVGKFIVDELIKQGFHLKILVRSPEKAPAKNPLIEVVMGSARNYSAIQRLLTECTAVISSLGPSKTETGICSVAARYVTGVMKQLNIRRYIEIAGLGLKIPGDKRRLTTRLISWAIKTFSSSTLNDRQKTYEILNASGVEWTIIRCPSIKPIADHSSLKINLNDSPGLKVSASALAEFIAGQIESPEYIRKCPFVAS